MAKRISKRDKTRFLEHFAETGNAKEAAELIGRSRGHLYAVRDKDPEFGAAWDNAEFLYLEGLQDTVYDWAENGFTIATQEQKADGTVVKRRIERRYDMRLAVRVLERRHPNWKPSQTVDVDAKRGVLVVPGIIEDPDEFDRTFSTE